MNCPAPDQPIAKGAPELTEGRCAHALTTQAGCAACVTVCPCRAWRVDSIGLSLETTACDRCGLCAAICPQEAIRFSAEPVVVTQEGCRTAYAACERVIPAGKPAHVPCLHALGIATLRKLHQHQVRRLIVSAGDCTSCPRGGRLDLIQTVRNLNRLLTDRRQPQFVLEQIAPTTWEVRTRPILSDRAPDLARRGFLRRLVAAEPMAEPLIAAEAATDNTAYFFSPQSAPNQLNVWTPQINPRRCTGCDLCARLCPRQAIALVNDEAGKSWYRLTPERCNGCGICRDLCTPAAIRLLPWVNGSAGVLELHSAKCRECRVEFHGPQSDQQRCPVCTAKSHPRPANRVVL